MFFYKIVANRVGKSEQFHSSKEQFECIAQKQADAMMVREKSRKPDCNWSWYNFSKTYDMIIL